MKRDFIKISERSGVSQEIGTALLEEQEKLFDRFQTPSKVLIKLLIFDDWVNR